ncbi:MAG: metallophosphoesterase [Clostridiales bacterium]|nr:MAG: metallophosphoesterase [Clostridiales bacterium]
MSILTISDLHLALGIDKPMDIFRRRLEKNYMERLKENRNSTVSDGDTVVIGGDISWATYLDEVYRDFEYIENLKGKKIILKGNHDYWWEKHNKAYGIC